MSTPTTRATSAAAVCPRILFQGSTRPYRSQIPRTDRLFPSGGKHQGRHGPRRQPLTVARFHTWSPGRTRTGDDTAVKATTTKRGNVEFLREFEKVESSSRQDDHDEDGKRGRIEYTVRRRRSDGSEVATLRINNPTRANSLGSGLLSDMTRTLHQLGHRRDLRLVEITGSSPSTSVSGADGGGVPKFCAGADLKEMYSLTTPVEARRFIESVRDACQALRDIPVPTLAKIDGATLGAGLELAASCDFRAATRRSVFAMPEVKVGIPSVVQARLLANIVGWQRTREMVYLGQTVDGDTAGQWGLVHRLAGTTEELDDACTEIMRTVVENGPKAMRSQKRLIRLWEEQSLREGVDAGVTEFADMWTEDGGEEVKKYMGRVLTKKKNNK